MTEPQYYDQTENAPCPYCGHKFDIVEMMNDEGADFEGAFLLAHPGSIYCSKCGNQITPEPNLEWRIWKAEEYDKARSKWDQSMGGSLP